MVKLVVVALCVLALGGCAATQPAPSPIPTSSAPQAPEDGVLLASLGFQHAPPGFSVPSNVYITDRVDAHNNVTLVLTSPDGAHMVSYLRTHLPAMGFKITADKNNSLLFEGQGYFGAYTASGALTALSLRTDHEG